MGVDPFNPLASVVVFQYNPDTMTRKLEPRAVSSEGDRSEPLRLTGPPKETITLSVEIDATRAWPRFETVQSKKLPPSSKVVSPRVVPLWKDHLFGGSGPQNLTTSFGKDFTDSERTAKTASFIRDQMKIEIAANRKKILTSIAPVTVDLTPRVQKTLAAIDKRGNPHAMDSNQIGEVAGNIAGGIGKDQLSNSIGAKPSPFDDDRAGTIAAELTRTATGIKVKPKIVFKIHDTIDLCPRNCGAITERDATISPSRFEATGLSGDVPFEIESPAPAASLTAFDSPIAGPSPVKPKGGSKPKAPSKGTAPSKPKGASKPSALSDLESSKEPLVLEESEKGAGSVEEPGPGFIAGMEIA